MNKIDYQDRQAMLQRRWVQWGLGTLITGLILYGLSAIH